MTEQQKSVIKTLRQYQPSRATVKGTDLQEIAKKHSGAILLSHRYCLLSANAAASRSPKRKKLNAASSVLMNAV